MKKTVLTALLGGMFLLMLAACGEHRRDTAPEPDGDTVEVVIPEHHPDAN